MYLNVKKYPDPIITPGLFPWRQATVFNPATICKDGKIYLMERAAGSLAPHICVFGLLESEDGIHFRHVLDRPVFTPAELGYPYGSVQDPRLVELDGRYYMTYALRRFCGCAYGYGNEAAMEYYRAHGSDPSAESNFTVSGLAVSDDLIHWQNLGFCKPDNIDDRDLILFPEKVNGKYVMLRRPCPKEGTNGAITICYADTLANGGNWGPQKVLLKADPLISWRSAKTGGATPPVKTPHGWLTLFHAVDAEGVYRVGVMMLDLNNPEQIIACAKMPFMEPDRAWEKLGCFIRNVVFPCGIIVRDDILFIYYGAADTSIGLAQVSLPELIQYTMQFNTAPDIEKNIQLMQ